MTESPLWPAPPPRRGAKIRHSWRCARQGAVVETTRRALDGTIVLVEMCTECESTDITWRLQRAAWQANNTPPEGPAAA